MLCYIIHMKQKQTILFRSFLSSYKQEAYRGRTVGFFVYISAVDRRE